MIMPSLLSVYLALGAAIVLEVAGTTALQASAQFTRPVPTLIMVVCYLSAFYFLTLALRVIPVGLAYAIWSGLGIVLISLIGLIVFKQKLDIPAIIGLGMIVSGVVVVNVFSKSIPHG
jgi:small multidrug resistance pump